MYRCESWAIKKADAFKLQCWRRLLRVPWTARRSNQSILKEIHPEYSLEELTLKLQYIDHLMWRADSLEKTLILGKTEAKRRRVVAEDEVVRQHHQFNGHEFEQTTADSGGQGSLAGCSPWSHKDSDTTLVHLNNNSEASKAEANLSEVHGTKEDTALVPRLQRWRWRTSRWRMWMVAEAVIKAPSGP